MERGRFADLVRAALGAGPESWRGDLVRVSAVASLLFEDLRSQRPAEPRRLSRRAGCPQAIYSMSGMDFRDIARQVYLLHQRGAFADALALVDQEAQRFPENAETLAYFRVCLLARMGDLDAAVRAFGSAIESGCCYSESQLKEDDDLAGLWARADFERLADDSAKRHAERLASVPTTMRVLEPAPSGGPLKLLFALHGNHRRASEAEQHWAPATRDGWLVALPESSERVDGMPVWNDRAAAEAQIIAQLSALCRARGVAPRQLVLAGFSRGAELALGLALRRRITACGCIAVAPSPSRVGTHSRAVLAGSGQPLRVALLVGAEDELYREPALELASALRADGVACRETIVPGLAHAFPDDFEEAYLHAALAFVARRAKVKFVEGLTR